MPSYQYSSLNEEAKEIRLLTLLQAAFSEDIRILLHTTPLTIDNTPVFEALSYTWGSADYPISIAVGHSGHETLAITQNLATALRYLRHEDQPRVLWIDAVCVDQQNLKERGHQVQRMGDIYKSADRVIVWLGPEDDYSASALKLMDDLSSKIEVDWLASTMKPTNASDVEWTDPAIPLPYGAQELLPIYHLLSRSWFERLWIRQEIRLASPNALLTCGLDAISWQSFRNAIFCLRNKIKRKDALGPNVLPFHERLELIFQLSDKASYITFGRLVRQTKHCKCSDPRDRVYALLSILDPSEINVEIKPDYSKTTGQVYQEAVLQFVAHFRDLRILTSCEMQDNSSLSVPTWVPNWSVGNTADPLWGGMAGGNSYADVQYLGDGILKATGVHSATISHVEDIVFANSSNSEIIEGIRRPAPPGIMHRLYPGGGALFDAYCRTLCADNFGTQYSPPLPHFPDLHESRDALRCILEGGKVSITPGGAAFKYLDFVWNFCKGRSFFTTAEGYIGLAPKAAQPGDHVAVLLGCPSPMLLRPNCAWHQVVGECYVCGLMNGEAILGALPSRYQATLLFDEGTDRHSPGFLDLETGLAQRDDPRLDALRYWTEGSKSVGESRDTTPANPRLTATIVKDRGGNLREFELA